MSREEKAEAKQLEEISKKEREDRKFKKARKDFEKWKIEHNVGTYMKQDDDRAIVFKDGEAFKMKAMEPRHGLPEIDLFIPEEEEEWDVNSVNLFMKKYAKLWKNLYYKYGNMLYDAKKPRDFDDLAVRQDTVSLAELRKLMDDHGFDKWKWITTDEIRELIKLVNFWIMKKYENNSLDFPAFKEWIIQAGIYMHTKKPHDYSEFPPIYSLEKMMDRMRNT